MTIKMKAYELVLQNHKLKTYRKISWLVVALNFFAFLFITYQLINTENFRWPLLGAVLILVFVIFFFLKKRRNENSEPLFLYPFVISMFTWIKLDNYWMPVIMFIILIFENLSKKTLIVRIDDQRIIYPSFPQKEIDWSLVKNVLIKDGLLTIDLKNNKLIQSLIIENEVNEENFNEFCNKHLINSTHQQS